MSDAPPPNATSSASDAESDSGRSERPDPVASPDDSLGGYFEVHERPPAFEGPDGHPYTVSMELEKTADLRAPFQAYLVFPRWASTGVGIVGHVETPTLAECRTSGEAREALASLTLLEVKELLDTAVEAADGPPPTPEP